MPIGKQLESLMAMYLESFNQFEEVYDSTDYEDYAEYAVNNMLQKNVSQGSSTQSEETSQEIFKKNLGKISGKIPETSWSNLNRPVFPFMSEKVYNPPPPPSGVSQHELDMITEACRESGKGVDRKEEMYLKEQFINDLFLVNNFIARFNEKNIATSSKITRILHDDNRYRDDFPSIVSIFYRRVFWGYKRSLS